jgi:hypothetical protein
VKWFTEIPIGIIRAYARAMRRLEAEASFLAVQRVAVGTGSLSRDDSRAITQRWQKRLSRARQRAIKATTRDLQAIGIGRRMAPKKA